MAENTELSTDVSEGTAGTSGNTNLWQIIILFVGLAVLMGLIVTNQASAPGVDDEAAAATEAAADESAETDASTETDVEPRVFFIEPVDGATVSTTFAVQMGAEGLTIEPAGEVREGAGHFHILIDAPFVEPGEITPADENHIHYGDASTEAELTLEPGEYTLRLQFADGIHTALEGNEYRDEITITVEE